MAKKWWFTFGSGQANTDYVTIEAPTYELANAAMRKLYGQRWRAQYDSAEAAGVARDSLILSAEYRVYVQLVSE